MKKLFKSIFPAGSSAYRFLSKRYRRLFKWWLPSPGSLDTILAQYAKQQQEVFFIQVGSNDGIANDPLHVYVDGHQWKGVLVEPVKFLFEQLKQNYQPNSAALRFENSAIGETNGTATFYRLNCTGINEPAWYSQIGSFNKQVLLAHKDRDDFESLIIEEKINTISFSSLLDKYQVAAAQLIHIDTEGFDYEILKQIDFDRLQPDIVIYEYVHLSLKDFRNSLSLLKKHGYRLYSSGLDIVCVKKHIRLHL